MRLSQQRKPQFSGTLISRSNNQPNQRFQLPDDTTGAKAYEKDYSMTEPERIASRFIDQRIAKVLP